MSIERICKNCAIGTGVDDYCYYCDNYEFGKQEFSDDKFIAEEQLVKEQCINDFKEIINNTEIICSFDVPYEHLIFDKGIKEYKEKLLERLDKYSKDK